MVSVTEVITPSVSMDDGGLTTAALPLVNSSQAAMPSTARSGMSFRKVVACCTKLAAPMPARLIAVTSTSTPTAASALSSGSPARPGQITVRLETTATASAALPTQTPIQ